MGEVEYRVTKRLAIPNRYSGAMKEIWLLQPRFEQRAGQRPFRLLEQPRFRAAYDFLLLRAECGLAAQELAEWWTKFQFADDASRSALIANVAGKAEAGEKKRRKPRRKPRAKVAAATE